MSEIQGYEREVNDVCEIPQSEYSQSFLKGYAEYMKDYNLKFSEKPAMLESLANQFDDVKKNGLAVETFCASEQNIKEAGLSDGYESAKRTFIAERFNEVDSGLVHDAFDQLQKEYAPEFTAQEGVDRAHELKISPYLMGYLDGHSRQIPDEYKEQDTDECSFENYNKNLPRVIETGQTMEDSMLPETYSYEQGFLRGAEDGKKDALDINKTSLSDTVGIVNDERDVPSSFDESGDVGLKNEPEERVEPLEADDKAIVEDVFDTQYAKLDDDVLRARGNPNGAP